MCFYEYVVYGIVKEVVEDGVCKMIHRAGSIGSDNDTGLACIGSHGVTVKACGVAGS